jgi:hypothetical protein
MVPKTLTTDSGAGGGIKLVRTLVPIAANGGKDPEVIDAAACTFLHEGREPDIRCKYEVGVRQH